MRRALDNGRLVVMDYVPQKSPVIGGAFAERDLQRACGRALGNGCSRTTAHGTFSSPVQYTNLYYIEQQADSWEFDVCAGGLSAMGAESVQMVLSVAKVEPIPFGVTFSKALSKLKARSSNVSNH